jgi:cytochrome c biogenesis protein
VRLGVVLLSLLGLACLIGMLIMQQNVDGFANYFQTLTPAQRLVYGKLGFFDIYHAWYFNVLLAVLSLNIILASIDRFPKTWALVNKPPLTVPVRWLLEQTSSERVAFTADKEEVAAGVESAMKGMGWRKPVQTEKNGLLYIFAQSGAWNRLGAYAVHVALLTIFFGGFLTAQFGSNGNLPLAPGQSSNLISETVVNLEKVNQITKQLPFEITFTDIQQRLIKKEGSISASNTLDWITRFTIKDETGVHEGSVQMNRPFDYRGYRFFQASFIPVGRARNITVRLRPDDGDAAQDLVIDRNGTTTLANGTKVRFSEFRGNFRIGPEDPNEDTSAYPNPAAILQVTRPGSAPQTAYAFGPQMANIPVAGKPVAGYTYQLLDFEKVSDQHVLSAQRDPGATVVYVGFTMLFITLVAVFFFSHQRVWAVVEKDPNNGTQVVIGGDSNRNRNAFADKIDRLKTTVRKNLDVS